MLVKILYSLDELEESFTRLLEVAQEQSTKAGRDICKLFNIVENADAVQFASPPTAYPCMFLFEYGPRVKHCSWHPLEGDEMAKLKKWVLAKDLERRLGRSETFVPGCQHVWTDYTPFGDVHHDCRSNVCKDKDGSFRRYCATHWYEEEKERLSVALSAVRFDLAETEKQLGRLVLSDDAKSIGGLKIKHSELMQKQKELMSYQRELKKENEE